MAPGSRRRVRRLPAHTLGHLHRRVPRCRGKGRRRNHPSRQGRLHRRRRRRPLARPVRPHRRSSPEAHHGGAPMKALRLAVDRVLGSVICVLMAAMVINVLWQVFTRFVLRNPSSFTEEAARYMMIWVGLLGSAYASGQKSHLALDLITARLQGGRKRASEILIQCVVLAFTLAVTVGGGIRLVWIQLSLGQQSAALQMKTGYVYLAVPIAGGLIVFYSIIALLDAVRGETATAKQSSGLN